MDSDSQARDAMTGVLVPQKSSKSLSASHLLKMDCANCHRENNTIAAPVIPFGDMQQLRVEIEKSPSLRERILKSVRTHDVSRRMPLGYPQLTEEEIAVLEQELRFVSSGPANACVQPSEASLNAIFEKASAQP